MNQSGSRRRLAVLIIVFIITSIFGVQGSIEHQSEQAEIKSSSASRLDTLADGKHASATLDQLSTKGRAPKTGYARSMFSPGWGQLQGCNIRNVILFRDLHSPVVGDECQVESGTLQDPYSGESLEFRRGRNSSSEIQIDHVVAVSDAWQKGAQQLSYDERNAFYNDPLNLLAVSGALNQEKGDSDAATWLPPRKEYRCPYVARQIAVKSKYDLWVTKAEKKAMKTVLSNCPDQRLPSSK